MGLDTPSGRISHSGSLHDKNIPSPSSHVKGQLSEELLNMFPLSFILVFLYFLLNILGKYLQSC